MTDKLTRTAFSTSRMLEFFSVKELQMQIGHDKGMWPIALVKELIDNALDACEGAGIAPEIGVVVDADSVTVTDNGPGLPYEVLRGSLDYSVRVSDKNHYIAPTRGQLGNALKTIWAAPFATNGQRGQVTVQTNGKCYTIDVTVDRIAGQPVLELTESESDVKNGTSITMHWPAVACYLEGSLEHNFYMRLVTVGDLVRNFSLFNPHATFTLAGNALPAVSNQPAKWLPSDPTSAHWYSVEALRNLIAAYLAAGQDKTVREFVGEFRGLSGSAKQKQVTDAAGLTSRTLRDLVIGNDLDVSVVAALLSAMQDISKPVKPESLGIIGKDAIGGWLLAQDTDPDSFQYQIKRGESDGIPYVLEVAFANYTRAREDAGRRIVTGLNWTPTLRIPFNLLSRLLGEQRVDDGDPVLMCLHLASPRLDFTDRGKSSIALPSALAGDLSAAIEVVTKRWRAAKNAAARQERLSQKQIEDSYKQQARSMSISDACVAVMQDAYEVVSSNGKYPANARQIMYEARKHVMRLTGGKFFKNSASFTQGILPDFMRDNPELTAGWDVAFDDRGHLFEPHTGAEIGLGTLNVRRYIRDWTNGVVPPVITPMLSKTLDTVGPHNRYSAVLFIEKEGFNSLLKASRLAERYDIAIESTKGQTTTAARRLAEEYTSHGVPVFVLHDFDKSGLEIVASYRTDGRRYQYASKPLIHDLGLRLVDVLALGIENAGAEDVSYDSKVHPGVNLAQCGATQAEINFFVRGGRAGGWHGKRVELNALTSAQFLTFIEGKLQEHGVKKVVPTDQDYLAAAYRRAVVLTRLQREMQKVFGECAKSDIAVPGNLHELLLERVEGTSASWDAVLADVASDAVWRDNA